MEAKDWITGFAAIAAALISAANLFLQVRDRGEKLLLEAGSRQPSIHPYTSFYVVNLGKSDVEIRDYGFVLFNGKLLSIPYSLEVAEPPYDSIDAYRMKDLKLPPSGHAEAGMVIPGKVAGYYVQSTTRSKPIFRFEEFDPVSKLKLRWTLWRSVKYA